MRISFEKLILLSIIILSALLRLINLGTIPIGFNDDEAAFGYNAHSILKTGKDEWGRFFPFPAFESFGDWKLVGYLYPVVVSQAVFGENEFATRFPSAAFGIAAIFTTYLLSKKLFEDNGWQSRKGSRQRADSEYGQEKLELEIKSSTGGKETTDRTRP
ncbi:hypothetical protein HYW40_02425, partial [Candidatus Curtissbacteria bacterium]|nr:hypothetical protein [Candidatus Curtissbacteria bacterium]